MRPAPPGQPLDRDDLTVLNFNRQYEAREHRLAIRKDRASAALAQLAAVFGSSEAQILPKDFEKSLVDGEPELVLCAVDAETNELLHGLPEN
jgi:hypothetical protein